MTQEVTCQEQILQFAKELGECLYIMRITKGMTLDDVVQQNICTLTKHQIEWAEQGYGELIKLEDLVCLATCYGKKLRVMFE